MPTAWFPAVTAAVPVVDTTTDTFYHLWAGSVGGPLAENRTFFWASTEGYDTCTTANAALTFPTAFERSGDYSQSFDAGAVDRHRRFAHDAARSFGHRTRSVGRAPDGSRSSDRERGRDSACSRNSERPAASRARFS